MKTERLMIRVAPDLKKKIERAAKEDDRTMSNWILKVVKEKLEENEMNISEKIRKMETSEIFEAMTEIATADIGNYALDIIFTINGEMFMLTDVEAPQYFLDDIDTYGEDYDWTEDQKYIEGIIEDRIADSDFYIKVDGDWETTGINPSPPL